MRERFVTGRKRAVNGLSHIVQVVIVTMRFGNSFRYGGVNWLLFGGFDWFLGVATDDELVHVSELSEVFLK